MAGQEIWDVYLNLRYNAQPIVLEVMVTRTVCRLHVQVRGSAFVLPNRLNVRPVCRAGGERLAGIGGGSAHVQHNYGRIVRLTCGREAIHGAKYGLDDVLSRPRPAGQGRAAQALHPPLLAC